MRTSETSMQVVQYHQFQHFQLKYFARWQQMRGNMKKDAEMRGGPNHREWPPKGTKKGPQKSKDVKQRGIITKIPQLLNSRPMQNKKWSENGMGWRRTMMRMPPLLTPVGPTSYSYTLRIYLSSINPPISHSLTTTSALLF